MRCGRRRLAESRRVSILPSNRPTKEAINRLTIKALSWLIRLLNLKPRHSIDANLGHRYEPKRDAFTAAKICAVHGVFVALETPPVSTQLTVHLLAS
jgi:hypothetical protein